MKHLMPTICLAVATCIGCSSLAAATPTRTIPPGAHPLMAPPLSVCPAFTYPIWETSTIDPNPMHWVVADVLDSGIICYRHTQHDL